VKLIVLEHVSAEHGRPECALGPYVGCGENDHLANHLHDRTVWAGALTGNGSI